MSTMCRQSVWSLAFLQAEWIPMLTDCTPEFTVLIQVEYIRKVSSSDWAVGVTPQ